MKDANLLEILEEHKDHLKEMLKTRIRLCEVEKDAGRREACYANFVTPTEKEIKKTVQCIAMVKESK